MVAFHLPSKSKAILESGAYIVISALLYRAIVWYSNSNSIPLSIPLVLAFIVTCVVVAFRKISFAYSAIILLLAMLVIPGGRLYRLIWDFGKMEFENWSELFVVNMAIAALFLSPIGLSLLFQKLAGMRTRKRPNL